MNDYMQNIREQICAVSDKNNWSMEKLSEACNLSYECITGILYGRVKDVKLSTLICLSHGLKLPIQVLVNEEEARRYEDEQLLNRFYKELSNRDKARRATA